MKKSRQGYLFVFASSLAVGVSFISSALAISSITPEAAGFYLFLFSLIASISTILYNGQMKEIWKSFVKYKKPMIALGIINSFAAVSWFHALNLIGPSLLAFLLRFSTIFVIVLSFIFLKEKLNKTEILGGAITVLGALIISYANSELLLLGMIFALIASILFSTTLLISKKYINSMPPMRMNAIRLFFMVIVSAGIMGISQGVVIPSIDILFFLAISGIAGPFLSFFFRFKAMEKMDLSKIAIVGSIEPFIIMIFSFIVFGEILQGNQLGGSLLIFLGITILILARHRPKIIAKWFP